MMELVINFKNHDRMQIQKAESDLPCQENFHVQKHDACGETLSPL